MIITSVEMEDEYLYSLASADKSKSIAIPQAGHTASVLCGADESIVMNGELEIWYGTLQDGIAKG